MTDSVAPSEVRVRVWDVPTRLVHWSMVVLIAPSWWTADTGRLDLHRYSGYLLLALLVFRLSSGARARVSRSSCKDLARSCAICEDSLRRRPDTIRLARSASLRSYYCC